MTGALAWLTHLAGSPPVPFAAGSIEEYWSAHRAALGRWETPIDGAIAGGFAADRLGFAFAAGYHAALCALVPSLEPGILTGLSATEAGGAHPRAIRSTLAPASQGGLLLSGEKRWSTLASLASGAPGRGERRHARHGAEPAPHGARAHGRAGSGDHPAAHDALRAGDPALCRDPRRGGRSRHGGAARGRLRGLSQAVPHARGSPRSRGSARVPRGGGTSRWLSARCRRAALALLAAAHTLASGPPAAPELHVALGGLLEATARLLEASSAHWARAEPAERERWDRDQPLLSVASGARQARLARAWATLPGEELAQTAEGD